MENDEKPELTPADALASTRAGREAIARRISLPWQWDAAEAASLGLFMAAVAYARPPWTTIAIAGWFIAFLCLAEARRRRTGIASAGKTRHRFDPVHVVIFVVAMALFTLGMIAGARWWAGFPLVTAALAAGVILWGYRWINRRTIARLRASE